MYKYMGDLRTKVGDKKFREIVKLFLSECFNLKFLKSKTKVSLTVDKEYKSLRIDAYKHYSKLNLYKFKLLLLDYLFEFYIEDRDNFKRLEKELEVLENVDRI